MTSRKIRQQFLDFFASKQHTIVESSPVVPHDDPTLMFTNAGMNQFKDVFLGTGSRSYTRAANTQKCIRAGGKHNDLDDVGQDTYHHTFFEMLGNWSFGDYFKKEAIEWAWELLTDVWKIDKDRLYVTYFEGDEAEGLEPDAEAAELWKTVTDIDPSHVLPGGKKDNFWEMGDTGPCGPCSEIHIDLTPDKSGAKLVNAGDPRVIELWNLVFIQFNRTGEQRSSLSSDAQGESLRSPGKLSPLPAKHIDTGLGFERLVAVLQGMEAGRSGQVEDAPWRVEDSSWRISNYDTDVFTPIFDAIKKRTGVQGYKGTLPTDEQSSPSEPQASACASTPVSETPRKNANSRGLKPAAQDVNHEQVMIDVSYRVIADHLRCLTFALTDGAIPSNEGRGYVLRRILRRAVRYGRQYMNMHEPFLCDLVEPFVEHMADVFPELRNAHGRKNVQHVIELIRDEEAAFFKTLDVAIRNWLSCVGRAFYEQVEKENREKLLKNPDEALCIQKHGFDWVDPQNPTEGVHEIKPETGFRIWRGLGNGRIEDDFKVSELTRERIERWCKTPPCISGKEAFKLHDTHGHDINDTVRMAEEHGMKVDIHEYERLMEEARQRARSATVLTPTPVVVRVTVSPANVIISAPRCDDSAKYRYFNCSAKVGGWLNEDGEVRTAPALAAEQSAGLLLDATCFYAEQGGQVGDTGIIETETGMFEVHATRHIQDYVVHLGVVRNGTIGCNQEASCKVDPSRKATMKNHTSTHLLNWALREVLGEHVQQKGSLVDPEKTRFDFSHNKPLTNDELNRIESLVNEKIDADLPVYADSREEDFVDEKEAREINTLRAVFGEKYPDRVRVVSIGAPITEDDAKRAGQADWLLRNPKDRKWMNYSVEFCGGTHLQRSSEAEHFVLTAEEGVAKGIRRVVGISGEAATDAEKLGRKLLDEVKTLAGPDASGPVAPPGPIPERERQVQRDLDAGPSRPDVHRDKGEEQHAHASVGMAPGTPGPRFNARADVPLSIHLLEFRQKVNDAVIPLRIRHQLRDAMAELQKKVKEHQKLSASVSSRTVMDKVAKLLKSAETINGVTVLVGEVPSAQADALRSAIDWIRNKTDASAVLLATVSDSKVTLIAGMSKAVVARGIKAGDLIQEIAPLVGGRGGGRPDMAQGGGNDPANISEALNRAKGWITEKLS